jgi:hypothetical protein
MTSERRLGSSPAGVRNSDQSALSMSMHLTPLERYRRITSWDSRGLITATSVLGEFVLHRPRRNVTSRGLRLTAGRFI